MNIRGLYRRIIPNIYLRLLEDNLKDCKSILDLGCGFKSPITNFSKTFYSVGIDIHEPYIEICRKRKTHDKNYCFNVFDSINKFKHKSFDCVIALGLIEHLTREEGFKLMEIMEKLARKKLIIFTPNGILPSKHKTEQIGHDHISGWISNDFNHLGYKIYGVNGLKSLKYEHVDVEESVQIKYRPFIFWKFISDISSLFLKNNPNLSFEILCVKKLSAGGVI